MLTAQPLTQDLAVGHKEALLVELARLSVAQARQWYAVNIMGGGRCHLSRAAVVRQARAFLDRLVVTAAQCRF